jgi:hypothetical protein
MFVTHGNVSNTRWRDVVTALARHLGVSVEAGFDPATGLPTASLGFGIRDASVAEQRDTLARVLDALESLCAERAVPLALVLDEFQEIHRFGGEAAEWHLRGIIQHHRWISYVAAGSRTHLIRRMLTKGRAFYRLFEILPFGAIDAAHLAGWIDDRFRAAGIEPGGVGAEVVRLAGPRTRDVVQLARKVWDRTARGSGEAIPAGAVAGAFKEIIHEESEPLHQLWSGYSQAQQNVLRAVAAGSESLTAAPTLKRFGLRSSAAASQSASRLVEQGVLEQVAPGHYRFDSPYQRGWVVLRALPDVGITRELG